MGKIELKRKLILIVASFWVCCSSAYAQITWQQLTQPISGKPMPIGSYTNGCLIGGVQVPFNGQGYQVVRREKKRYFAHPEMRAYLQRLGKRIHQAKLPNMLISDIAMPAGGRFATGHRSHQMGLDVDIWFRMGKLTEQSAHRSTGLATLMVNTRTQKMTKNWTNKQAKLLELVASDKAVARVFVNPVIKIHLCKTIKKPRPWLRKIRPWYGHNAHFHIRLHCPNGAIHCQNQASLPQGDGCDESLYAWLKPKPKGEISISKPEVIPLPPARCQAILTKQASILMKKEKQKMNLTTKTNSSGQQR